MSSITNTENNYLIYYYNDDESQRWRLDKYDTTHMRIGGCTRAPFSFKTEIIRTARTLISNYPDLTLFMSGGMDSEIALKAFLSAGLRPKLVTVRFPNGGNDHDIGPMLKMVQAMGLQCKIIDFDIEKFVESGECYEVAKRYQAYSLYQQMLLRIAEGYAAPMITIDEVELEKVPSIDWDTGKSKMQWIFLKKEDQDGVWRRFNDKTGIPALNNFYTYSPESMLSFLDLPTVDNLINDRIPGKLGWTSSKMQIYAHTGFQFRPRPKFTGVENYMHLWQQVGYNIHEHLGEFLPRVYGVPALELRDNLRAGKETSCHIL
jgi:hypothetical protein